MKALMRFYEVDIQLEYLPTLILQTEADELGISAGLQDRVIQTYEGCVFMDFDRSFMDKHQYGKYEKLDPENLDNLYLAYKTNLSKVSGTVLNDIRTRFAKQEPLVVDTLQEIAGCAEEGKKALQHKDMEALNQLIDKNFNLRAKIMNITPSNQEMITAARSCGASAKFSGSGGAIIGRYEDDEMLNRLVVALKKIDARVIKPYII